MVLASNVYEYFLSKSPDLTRQLLDTNHDVSRLLLAIIDSFLTYCRKNSISPNCVKVSGVDYSEDEGFPEAKFTITRTLKVVKSLNDLGGRRYGEWDIKEWQRDLNTIRTSAVEQCDDLFNALKQIAIKAKSYCDFKEYNYATLTISPSAPPTLFPDGSVRIPLHVIGHKVRPEPIAEVA